MLEYVPDHLLKTQETCNEIMRTMPAAFHLIPDHLKHKKCVSGALK